MKLPVLYSLLFLSFQAAAIDAASVRVSLLEHNKPIALQEHVEEELRQRTLELVRSSNFNSASERWRDMFSFTDIQQDYRDSVAGGDYLLITISPAQKFETLGGEVTAAQIVVGLHRPRSKNAVFTIDESGRIVSHAKYGGEIFLELENLIAHSLH